MTLGSLFAGIGGFDLGLERAGFEVKWQVEIDEFCRKVLAKHWPNVARYSDVCDFEPDASHAVDAICGGFPCQDVSCAGKGAGLTGERSGLFAELHRIVAAIRPRWGIFENVPALRTRGYDRVASSLEALGYTCWPLVVGAEHVGAPHRRHRVWVVAHCARDGQHGQPAPERADRERTGASGNGRRLVHAAGPRLEGHRADAGKSQVGQSRSAGASELGDAGSAASERNAGGFPAPKTGERRARKQDGDCAVGPESTGPIAGLADAERMPIGRRTSESGRRESGRTSARWPSRPGERQHDWERPRLVELRLGESTHGLPRRLAGLANRNGLRACGNSIVPACAEAIGRAIMQAEGLTRLRGEE